MPKSLLPLIFFFSTLAACSESQKLLTEPPLYFTGEVDSLKVFPSGQNILNEFVFSPLTGHDKIWVYKFATTPMELDLLSEEWTPLSKKYHEKLSHEFLAESIWKDSLTNEVFITFFNDGVLYFPVDGSAIKIFPLQGVQSVINTKEEILAGTSKGLYTIDKRKGTALKVPGFPMDIWVKNMQVLNHDTLVINSGSMYFPYTTKSPGKMLQYQSGAGVVYSNPFLKMLPRDHGGTHYRLYHDDLYTYMYADTRLYIQDTSKVVYEIKNRPEGNIMGVKSDARYVYLLYKDAFVILNKEKAMRHASLFDAETYHQYRAQLRTQLYALEELSLDSFLVSYAQLRSDTIFMAIPEFQQSFSSALSEYFTRFWMEDRMTEIESAVTTHQLEQEFEPYALLGLCMKYFRAADLDKTSIFYQQMTDEYPEFEYQESKSVLQCAMGIKPRMDSLNRLSLARDEFLYKEAQLKKELVECGWAAHSMYDYTIVASNYKEILSKYPNGAYADNAAFYFLSMMQYGDEGQEYSKDQVNACHSFLKKYPGSDVRPNVQYLIAINYYSYYGELDSMILMKEAALAALEKIEIREIRDSNLLYTIREYKLNAKREILDAVFEAELHTPKTEYKIGEDVNVTMSLKNVSSKVRQIRLFAHEPVWSTHVGPRDQERFTPEETRTDTSTHLISILPGETISHEVNLTKKARYWKDSSIGRYTFETPGNYYVNFTDGSQKTLSTALRIYFYN